MQNFKEFFRSSSQKLGEEERARLEAEEERRRTSEHLARISKETDDKKNKILDTMENYIIVPAANSLKEYLNENGGKWEVNSVNGRGEYFAGNDSDGVGSFNGMYYRGYLLSSIFTGDVEQVYMGFFANNYGPDYIRSKDLHFAYHKHGGKTEKRYNLGPIIEGVFGWGGDRSPHKKIQLLSDEMERNLDNTLGQIYDENSDVRRRIAGNVGSNLADFASSNIYNFPRR